VSFCLSVSLYLTQTLLKKICPLGEIFEDGLVLSCLSATSVRSYLCSFSLSVRLRTHATYV